MARTKYQALQVAKGQYCKGKTTKSAVKKKATAYIKDAVAKAKKAAPKGQAASAAKAARIRATKSANRVLQAGCTTKPGGRINGKKKGSKRKARK